MLDPMRDPMNYPGIEQYNADDFAKLGSQKLELDGEPIIKADALAYVMFEKPDIAKQKQFLLDFGLLVAYETENAVYMRGYGPNAYLYVARKGPKSKFIGAGFAARSHEDLETLSKAVSKPIEKMNDFTGGDRVRLTDPNGWMVDVIVRAPVAPIAMRQTMPPFNTPWKKERLNRALRPALQPCPVERIGHYVILGQNFTESAQWYMRHIGFIPSDALCADDGTPIGAFMRLDRGAQPADHHTVFLSQGIEPKFLHSAYEVVDLDAIGQGGQYLKARGHAHSWGIGRHILGSQIFDYWRDPYGDEIEHYADGDVYDNMMPTQYRLANLGGNWQWGDDFPKDVLPKIGLREMIIIIKGLWTKKLDLAMLQKMKKAFSGKPRPWMK